MENRRLKLVHSGPIDDNAIARRLVSVASDFGCKVTKLEIKNRMIQLDCPTHEKRVECAMAVAEYLESMGAA